jgi:hypothetical protein
VIVSDNDIKLIAQARAFALQLKSLVTAYESVKISSDSAKLTTNALPAGIALYGAGAALKEVASFTQLFRTDTTLYTAVVNVDQETLVHAVAGCTIKVNRTFYTPKSLLVSSLSKPDQSDILMNLKRLSELRINADAEMARLSGTTKADDKAKQTKLIALNTTMDAMISTIFTTSEKVPEPQFVSILAGEAILQKVGDGANLFRVTLVNAAATGVKRTSIWLSDRLYSWSTVTVDYVVFDPNGAALVAGAVNVSPDPKKIKVTW